MTGNEVHEQKYEKKLNDVVNSNLDKPYIGGYINFISSKNSITTTYAYALNVLKFMNYAKKNPQDLMLDDYTGYMSSLKRKTSSYQISVYAALKKFSKYLYANEINMRDPMNFIERPKFVEGITTKRKRESGYLTEEEIVKYMESVKSCIGSSTESEFRKEWKERDLAIVILLLNTGMRCSALYKLNVDSIDFHKKTIITVDKEEKTEVHYLSDKVVDVLKDWIDKRSVLLEDTKEDALFVSNRKQRMSNHAIFNVVEKYAVNIEGKHITPHKLRATYATQIYEKTHDLYLVQQSMGHASPKTSELYIRGKENSSRKKASEIMSGLTF